MCLSGALPTAGTVASLLQNRVVKRMAYRGMCIVLFVLEHRKDVFARTNRGVSERHERDELTISDESLTAKQRYARHMEACLTTNWCTIP
jgi:hypothetical protein